MAKVAIMSYIRRKSLVHELTGTTKLVFFLLWSVAAMVTYDTRVLLCMLAGSFVIFKISKVRFREVRFVLGLAAVFLLMNNLFVFTGIWCRPVWEPHSPADDRRILYDYVTTAFLSF